MSRTQLLSSPPARPAGESDGRTNTCRFASNCSCVFNRGEAALISPAPLDPRYSEKYASLIERGWKVASADSHHIVMQRRRNIPFCVDVLLCAVTIGLWSIHMVYRGRHPKVETTTLTLAPKGDAA